MKYLRFFGWVVVVASVAYFSMSAWENRHGLSTLAPTRDLILAVIFGITLYMVVSICNGYSWSLLLKDANKPSNPKDAITVVLISQFAKYIPGNVAQMAGRVVLARTYSMDMPRVFASMMMEAAWSISVGSVIGFSALIIGGKTILKAEYQDLTLGHIAFVGLITALLPLLAIWCVNHFRPKFILSFIGEDRFQAPEISVIARVTTFYTANFVVFAVILESLAAGLLSPAWSSLALVTGISAIAWVAGFITPGAPGGLGIREAILLAGLTPIHGPEIAITITLYFRVVTVAGDFGAFILGLGFRRLWAPQNK